MTCICVCCLAQVNRKQKDGTVTPVNCPVAVAQYTSRMGGVDRFDQRRELYSVSRRSRRWWLRIFYFMLDAALVNAHILYNSVHPGNPMTQLTFRSRVFRGLVANYSSRKRRPSIEVNFCQSRRHKAGQKPRGVPDEIRLQRVGVHFPKQVAKFSRCRICSTKTHCKRSRVQCAVCCVPLCIDPCFEKFHADS